MFHAAEQEKTPGGGGRGQGSWRLKAKDGGKGRGKSGKERVMEGEERGEKAEGVYNKKMIGGENSPRSRKREETRENEREGKRMTKSKE